MKRALFYAFSAPHFSMRSPAGDRRVRLCAAIAVLGPMALSACSGEADGAARTSDTGEMNAMVAPEQAIEANNATETEPLGPDSEVPGTGANLAVRGDWIPNSSNGVGVQGSFFTYGDGSTRTSIAQTSVLGGSGYCVAGEAAQVIDGDFGGTWGAVAALNLRQPLDSAVVSPYDAEANGVVGFGFEIVGNTGGLLRFVAKQYDVHDGFCAASQMPDCAEGCSVEVLLEDMTQNCWEPGGQTPVVSSLAAIEWQITTSEDGATPFDYCIENLHAVMESGNGPGAVD